MRFRASVFSSQLNWGCRTLLLLMADGMNENCIVSIPRTTLASELNCAEARVSEWVREAREAGFLSVVKAAKPGRTAVYQGLRGVRTADPSQGYAEPDTYGYADRTPQGYAERVATEVVPTAPDDQTPAEHLEQRGQEEEQESSPARWGRPVAAIAEGRWGA